MISTIFGFFKDVFSFSCWFLYFLMYLLSSSSETSFCASSNTRSDSKIVSDIFVEGISSFKSVLIFASSLLIIKTSLFSINEFLIFGVKSSKFLYIFSILLYSINRFVAVFSPTPGSPGILSDGSPFNARYSTYWFVLKPNLFTKNFSSTKSTSEIPLFVYKIFVFVEISWNVSLSPVTIKTFLFFTLKVLDREPRTSSASKPFLETWGMLNTFKRFWSRGIWILKLSGADDLFAL